MFKWVEKQTMSGNKLVSYISDSGIELGSWEKTGRGIVVTINTRDAFEQIKFFVIRPKDAEKAIMSHEFDENPVVKMAKCLND